MVVGFGGLRAKRRAGPAGGHPGSGATAARSGRRAGAYVYGTLNKIGLKRGNVTTRKGMKAAKRKR